MDNNKRFIIFFLSPILILFSIFYLFPTIWGIALSFYRNDTLRGQLSFVGFGNYIRLLQDRVFIKVFGNTIFFIVVSVSVNIIISLFIAIGLNSIKMTSLRNILRTAYFLPAIAPLAASSIIWSTIFNERTGLLKLITDFFEIKTIHWLSDTSIVMYSIIILTLWADIGFNIVILMAALDGISITYYEAAYIDGASRIRVIWNITIPLLSRIIFFTIVMTIISYSQAFAQFDILTHGGPQNASNVLTLYMYQMGFKFSKLGYSSAIATVLFLLVLIVTIIQIRISKRDWEY